MRTTKYVLGEFRDAHGPGVCLVDVGDGSEAATQLVIWEWRGERQKCWGDARKSSKTLNVIREVYL